MKIPDRWLKYSKHGRIKGTRFVAFKTPLKEEFNRNLPSEERFIPSDVLDLYSNIKLVIDLTFTLKYYNGVEEFRKKQVQYEKFKCRGHTIPDNSVVKQFIEIVDKFIQENPEDYLIGVHCTHGVNRTGYLIVRYMIERLGYSPDMALKEFYLSRGHAIERTNYIQDLQLCRCKTKINLEVRQRNVV